MNFELNKRFIEKLNILMDFEDVFNEVSESEEMLICSELDLSKIFHNISVKMCRISGECNALDISEDKVNNNKQFNCFWPKCLFIDNNVYHLKEYTFLSI